jgi:hypothetical protein
VDSWISALVRQRARAVALRLHLGLVPGLGVLHGFGLGLGFQLDPGGVFAAGLLPGLFRRVRKLSPGNQNQGVKHLPGSHNRTAAR